MERTLSSNRIQVEKYLVLAPLAAAMYISLTNLTGGLAPLYVMATLGYCLLMPVKYSMGILVVNAVYLGYSYIDIYPNAGVSNYGYLHLAYLVVGTRGLIDSLSSGKLRVNPRRIPLAVITVALMAYVTLCQRRLSNTEFIYSAALMLAVWHVAKELKKPGNARLMAWYLVMAQLCVFVYYVLQRDVYRENDGRFPGTRDANNFALYCNLAILLFNSYCKDVPRKWKLVINGVLGFGVLITISFSGIVSLAAIIILLIPKRTRNGFILSWCMAAGLMGVLIMCVAFPHVLESMGSAFGRVAEKVNSIMSGDFAGATTGRAQLWEYYLDKFEGLTGSEQLFGNQKVVDDLHAIGVLAPHNTYIDMLLDYGIVGLGLLCTAALGRALGHLRRKEYVWLMVNLLLLVNIIFRTFSGITLYLFILV